MTQSPEILRAPSTIAPRASARFVGATTNRLDAKGRVSVPADFRRQLEPSSEAPSSALYVFPSLLRAELQCGGADLVDLLLQIVRSTDVFDDRREEFENLVTEETERLYFDDAGRVVLPKALREHGKFDGSVVFSGRGPLFVMSAKVATSARGGLRASLSEAERETIRVRSLPSSLSHGGDAG